VVEVVKGCHTHDAAHGGDILNIYFVGLEEKVDSLLLELVVYSCITKIRTKMQAYTTYNTVVSRMLNTAQPELRERKGGQKGERKRERESRKTTVQACQHL